MWVLFVIWYGIALQLASYKYNGYKSYNLYKYYNLVKKHF